MTVVIFILVLAILIIVHELGHFIVAKKSGIRVDEFGLGFPPKAWGYKPKGSETTYSINWLPFGGFVRIFGEDPTDEEAISGPDSDRSFVSKTKGVQAMVLIAGIVFNIVFAWLIFSIGFMVGMPQSSQGKYADQLQDASIVVTSVLNGSPAESAGLMTGDKIVEMEGESSISVDSIQSTIAASSGDELLFLVDREGSQIELSILPEDGIVSENPAIGIMMANIGTVQLPVHLALWEGLMVSGEMITDVAVGFSTLIYQSVIGQANLAGLSGPVGIAGMVGDASTLGFLHLALFMAFISINLAVLNLIPFPALDGGRLLFVLIEKIKGSPINPKVAVTVNFIGFALLLILLLVVTYNDIVRLF